MVIWHNSCTISEILLSEILPLASAPGGDSENAAATRTLRCAARDSAPSGMSGRCSRVIAPE
jgi:hypothetical protein